jgi:hypothetical protein
VVRAVGKNRAGNRNSLSLSPLLMGSDSARELLASHIRLERNSGARVGDHDEAGTLECPSVR